MNPRRLRVTVLGSTGSVGVSTLDVMARHPERYEVFALSAATRVAEMLAAEGAHVAIVGRAENVFDEKVVTRNQAGSIDLGTPRRLWIGVRLN